jgi:hypothetical protein
LLALCSCVFVPLPAAAIVINEILYHAADADDRPYEYIELYNENPDPLDLSDYSFCNGVSYVFPEDTFLDGRSFVIVCADPAAFSQRYPDVPAAVPVLGPWTGALENSGERIELCNPAGISIVDLRFNDRGKWHSGADGTGHSLSLITPYSDFTDPDAWTLSAAVGGTPGADNGHVLIESGAPPSTNPGLDFNGFILDWLVLGPYTGAACFLGSARLQGDWLRESAGGALQTDILWEDGQAVNTNYSLAESDALHANAGTARPTVKEFKSFSDTVNFNDNVWPPDPNNVMAYAFCYVDNITGSNLAVDVACASDDAIAVMLNGVHVHTNDACRGVGNPGQVQDRAAATLEPGKNLVAVKVFENGGGWSFRLRFERRGSGQPLLRRSEIQVMTDYSLGLDFSGGGTPLHDPTEEPPPPGGGPSVFTPYPVVINEGLLRTSGERWIELYNRGSQTVDLSGFHITDTPADFTKSTIVNGTSIAPGAFLVFSEAQIGFSLVPDAVTGRVYVGLTNAAGARVLDAYNFEPAVAELSEARVPDGSSELSDGADPTRGLPNAISPNSDIVINEVMYHSIDFNDDKEFVELHNRGNQSVDLSGWAFTNGIDFAIPDGTVMLPGSYLVVARNRGVIRSIYGLGAAEVLGPDPANPTAVDAYGKLRDGGERITLKDALGRTVDTVRYHDGGEWSRWADGLGSSLELIDARQDNGFGQAWDASDDSAKAATQQFAYVGRHIGGESELAMLLNTRGIVLVDDVSIQGGGLQTTDTPLIDQGETWRYVKGTASPTAAWKDIGFGDGSWLSGATGIGYGDGDDATVLTDMQNGYLTIFCRKTFNVADVGAIDELILSVVIDDGFNAYLNGTLVASHNVSGEAFDSPANTAVTNGDLIERDISSQKGLLRNGTNVLSFSVHNTALDSTDLSFNPRLLNRTTETVGGGAEHLTNGHFNSNTTGWMIEGTHIRTGRTTVSPISGAGSLKLIATGRGDNKVNRIETPDAAGTGMGNLPLNQDLAISFRARWVVGSRTLVTHGYEHEMAKSHTLAVPENLGTPGRVNSVTQRLIAQAGGNLGPVFTDVSHSPVVPLANETVTVRAKVSDADGIGAVQIRYSLNDPSASPTSRSMTHRGGGVYEGTIPGQTLNTRVVFYITATDSGGRAGRYPEDIRTRTHPLVLNPSSPSLSEQRHLIYRHDNRDTDFFHRYRFYMTSADESYLSTRQLHSNDAVPGSFVFNSTRLYYESGTRFSGSPFARGGWGGSFRAIMPRDNELHGRIHKFNLDNHHGSGLTGNERISHYLLRLANGAGVPVPYSDTQTVARWEINSRGANTLEQTWVPDVQFVELWYPDDSEGDLYEMDDRFVFNDSGGRIGNTDARVLYPPPSSRSDGNGANKENYRWFHGLRAKNGLDDYGPLIDFAQLLDPNASGSAAFDARVFDELEVEEFLRIWCVRLNTDDWDQWGASRGKNCYLYRSAIGGRWHLMAWDLELTYGNVNAFLIPDSPSSAYNPGGFSEVNRFFNRPAVKRLYYGILDEMVNGAERWFHSDRLTPYMDELQAMGMGNTTVGRPGGFIDQRSNLLRTRISSVVYPQMRLAVTTNGGANFSTSSLAVNLAGNAPADVSAILINGEAYTTTFTGMTTWSITGIPLIPGVNDLSLFGFDMRGRLVDTDSITITSTATAWGPPVITAVTPNQALPGVNVDITGSEFHNGVQVFFGPTPSPSVVYSETGPTPSTIRARVPNGAGTVQVTVQNVDGKTSNGLSFTFLRPPPQFIRGDVNRDQIVDVSDAVKALFYLFRGHALDCEDAADVDDSESINVTDAIQLLEFLFKAGVRPRAPYPAAGNDPSGTALDCEA